MVFDTVMATKEYLYWNSLVESLIRAGFIPSVNLVTGGVLLFCKHICQYSQNLISQPSVADIRTISLSQNPKGNFFTLVWREPKEQREQSQVHLSTAESWLGKIKNQIVLLRGLASSQITENVIIICTRMCVRTIMILPALSGCITLLFVIYLLADACRPHLLFPITTIRIFDRMD